jgi:tetratricopeptide (TPR) repeat protein
VGTAAAVDHFKALRTKFPQDKGVVERGFNHAAGALERMCGQKKYAEALAETATYAPLADGRVAELKARVYDGWASSLAAGDRWEAAVEKYVEGLKADPKNGLLVNNAIATIDQWAGRSMDRRDWAATIAVYETGLRHFPDNGHLKNNRDYCREQQNR